MPALEVSRPRLERDGELQTLSADFSVRKQQQRVWFRTGAGPINASPEPFLPVALIPSMRRHWSLHMEGQVSSVLLDGVDRIQKVMSGWYREFRRVDVRVSACEPGSASTGVAAFFSGGVDSFFTLLRHRDEITHLVFVVGFDIRLNETARRMEASENARQVADRLGLELVEVETNLRDFGDPHVDWPKAYFGAGMAAVALLLAPRFKRIYVPASIAYEHLIPVGSHPELDSHWGNGQIEVVHDGAEFDRFEKIRIVADWDVAAEHLRICYDRKREVLNCGRCEKCLWTMLVLEAVGRLQDVITLPDRIDLQALRNHPPHDEHQRIRFVKAIAHLDARAANPELRAVLAELLAQGERENVEIRARKPWWKLAERIRRAIGRR